MENEYTCTACGTVYDEETYIAGDQYSPCCNEVLDAAEIDMDAWKLANGITI